MLATLGGGGGEGFEPKRPPWGVKRGGGGVCTKPWWLALLACGGAYWPLAFEPSAMLCYAKRGGGGEAVISWHPGKAARPS